MCCLREQTLLKWGHQHTQKIVVDLMCGPHAGPAWWPRPRALRLPLPASASLDRVDLRVTVITTRAGEHLGGLSLQEIMPLFFSISYLFFNFLAVQGLRFCVYSPFLLQGLGTLTWVASLVAENGHRSPGSSACSTAQLLQGTWGLPIGEL